MITGKHVLVTGGTGSLGKVLVRRLLSDPALRPASVTVFSRDEAKQEALRQTMQRASLDGSWGASDGTPDPLRFRIGSVTDPVALGAALRRAEVVINAAALKQVPNCEYHPVEAVRTNVDGAANIVRLIAEQRIPVETVVGVSTDKACQPVNVMGMTKALQERIFIQGNLEVPGTRFVVARYGNVLASRGSVIPLFHEQIRRGGPLTLTTPAMTRFFMNLEQAVDTVLTAAEIARAGEIVIPRIPSAHVIDVARALIGDRDIEMKIIGVRPGEKIHESLVSFDEAARSVVSGSNIIIRSMLPEFSSYDERVVWDGGEYSSATDLLDEPAVLDLLVRNKLRIDDAPTFHDS